MGWGVCVGRGRVSGGGVDVGGEGWAGAGRGWSIRQGEGKFTVGWLLEIVISL